MFPIKTLAPLTLALAFAWPLAAQTTDHSGHAMGGMSTAADPAADNPAVNAYIEAQTAMHEAMAIDYTGNADVDFVRGMIPHHEGAVAMAKIELEYGQDPEIRALAEAVIKAQDAEIAFMKAWLEKNAAAE